MRVTVTKKDIAMGRKLCATRCPIALAVRRKLKRVVQVRLGEEIVITRAVSKERPGKLVGYLTKGAVDFAEAFDNGLPVQPFTFELTKP